MSENRVIESKNTVIDLRQCWETPLDFWEVANAEFEFQIDIAATAENRKCERFISLEQDALGPFPWLSSSARRGWLNPPFKKMMPWADRSYVEGIKHPDSVVCMLGPLSAAPWLTDFCDIHASEIRDLYPRPQFTPPPGIPMTSNAKDNVMVVFRRKPAGTRANRFTWRWK